MKQMSTELTLSISSMEKLLKLIWFGQFLSLGIYVFLGFKRMDEMRVGAEKLSSLAPILGLCGVALLLASFGFRWFTFSIKAISKVASNGMSRWVCFIPTQSTSAPSLLSKEAPADLCESERNLFEYGKKLFTILIIQWGCVHTVALYGMIIPSPQPLSVIAGATVTTIAMFFHFPNIRTKFSAGLELAEFERGINRNEY